MGIAKNQEFEITIEDIGNDGEGIGHVEGIAVFVKDAVPGDVARIKIIKDKKRYAYGRLMEIIKPSIDRVTPICPHAKACGGCSIMQLSYDKQLVWKQNKVENCLKRIGGIENAKELMEPIIGMKDDAYDHAGDEAGNRILTDDRTLADDRILKSDRTSLYGGKIYGDRKLTADIIEEGFPAIRYRNKAQFPVGRDKDGNIVIGFYAGRTHSIIDTDVCYLQHPVNDEIIRKFRGFLEEYNVEPYDEEKHTGLVRHILTRVGKHTGEVMVCVIINGDELTGTRSYDDEHVSLKPGNNRKKNGSFKVKHINVEHELVSCMKDIPGITSVVLNTNKEKTNRILGDKCRTIWGSETITDYIGDVKYQINPLSFFQVNPTQTAKLYQKALEYAELTGDETVWDLYCGIGTISLFLAQKAKRVMGVEIIPEAIYDARKNAKLNGLENAEFFVGKAEEVLPREYEKNGIYADVIVVDPPRKGCDIVALNTMLKMAPKRIVYVSCDPATLARDLKILTEATDDKNNVMYEVKKVCAVDQFSHSGHVETVCQLIRRKSDADVHITVDMEDYYRIKGDKEMLAAQAER